MSFKKPTKRGHGTHLSKVDKEALRRDIRAGFSPTLLAKKYNLVVRTIHVHKAKLEGRYSDSKITTKPDGPPKHLRTLCRHGDCQETGEGTPPYCQAHKPAAQSVPKYSSTISPIPLKRLMGGKA